MIIQTRKFVEAVRVHRWASLKSEQQLLFSASMRGVEVKQVPRDFAFSGARHSLQNEAETDEIGEVASGNLP